MEIQEEIKFVEKLRSANEPEKALKYCEHLLSLTSERGDLENVIIIRNQILGCTGELIRNEADEANWSEYRNIQFDRLFENYLMAGDRSGAAQTLLGRVGFYEREGDRSTLEKVIDLFSGNSEPEVRNVVREAFSFLLNFCSVDDPYLLHVASRYLQFSSMDDTPKDTIDSFLCEVYEWDSPHLRGDKYIELVDEFLLPLGEPSSSVKFYMSSAYARSGRLNEALKMRFDLLLADGESIGPDDIMEMADWCEDIGALSAARIFRDAASRPYIDDQ